MWTVEYMAEKNHILASSCSQLADMHTLPPFFFTYSL